MARYREQGLSCQGRWRLVGELVFIFGNKKPWKSFKRLDRDQICTSEKLSQRTCENQITRESNPVSEEVTAVSHQEARAA